jgi:hypothetical protein
MGFGICGSELSELVIILLSFADIHFYYILILDSVKEFLYFYVYQTVIFLLL